MFSFYLIINKLYYILEASRGAGIQSMTVKPTGFFLPTGLLDEIFN